MKLLKIILNRFFIISLAIILQMALYIFMLVYGFYSLWPVTTVIVILSVGVFLRVIKRDMMPEQKVLWTALLAFVPIIGLGLYMMLGDSRFTRRTKLRMRTLFFKQAPSVKPAEEFPERYSGQIKYIMKNAGTLAYRGCKTEYFPTGEDYFEALKRDLKRAKEFILLEYFIVADGKMFGEILSILEEKVRAGVEVVFMYDDIGSVWKVRGNYYKKLRKRGLKCVKFNRYIPFVTNFHNNRDHRKIAVIDGKVAYTGGVNLSDEYINEAGNEFHWKDSGVRIEGNAVGEFAELFLQLYGMTVKDGNIDFGKYIEKEPVDFGGEGLVLPFGTGPAFFYSSPVATEAFLNMINGAREEIIIATPYLIIDYSLTRALCSAVQRGVKVSVVIPGVPDKKIIYLMTCNNADGLVKNGVDVYVVPGTFLHSKSIIADGEVAIVGTINFDYRSLIHHFENAVWMYKTDAVTELRADLVQLLKEENKFGERHRKGFFKRLLAGLLEIFAPLF